MFTSQTEYTTSQERSMNVLARTVGLGLLMLATGSWSSRRASPNPFNLPNKLSVMTQDKSFHNWVITLDWTADEVPARRTCEGSDACNTAHDWDYVLIQPVGDARNLTPATVGSIGKGYGVVIGRIRQDPTYGKNQERKYHVPVGKDYAYVVVQPASDPKQEPTYVVVLDKGNGKTLGAPATFHDCKDGNVSSDKLPHAAFEECGTTSHAKVSAAVASVAAAEARYKSKQAGADTVLRNARANLLKILGDDVDGPAWFSCALGCCTAE